MENMRYGFDADDIARNVVAFDAVTPCNCLCQPALLIDKTDGSTVKFELAGVSKGHPGHISHPLVEFV